MVNSHALGRTFQALADPTRQAIVEQLASLGSAPVSTLATQHSMSLPGVLKHIRVLEAAGLVTTVKVGRVRLCRLAPHPLAEAHDWIESNRVFWETQLQSLDRYLLESARESNEEKS